MNIFQRLFGKKKPVEKEEPENKKPYDYGEINMPKRPTRTYTSRYVDQSNYPGASNGDIIDDVLLAASVISSSDDNSGQYIPTQDDSPSYFSTPDYSNPDPSPSDSTNSWSNDSSSTDSFDSGSTDSGGGDW